jgi:hypothetical protein
MRLARVRIRLGRVRPLKLGHPTVKTMGKDDERNPLL